MDESRIYRIHYSLSVFGNAMQGRGHGNLALTKPEVDKVVDNLNRTKEHSLDKYWAEEIPENERFTYGNDTRLS